MPCPRCALIVIGTGTPVHGNRMKSPVKNITRRELFREMASKDTLKQVMSAWYGFSRPLSEEQATNMKKSSLLETIKKVDLKHFKDNGKEG